MDENFNSVSTAILVENFAIQPRKYHLNFIGGVLDQLIQRALVFLQELQSLPEDEDRDGAVSGNLLSELSLLYDDRCCVQLINLLSSAAIGPRGLAGAAYLLALLTAGGSSYAEDLRNKMVKGPGVTRLVALLSDESVSVRFNSLLVLGNLLRHCPCLYSEILRLGGLRKLARLVEQACEEPQQNLCVDAFVCLCDAGSPETCQRLLDSGSAACLLQWVQKGTSERVAKKAVKSIHILLEKVSTADNGILQLQLVKPLLALIEYKSEDLQLAAWKVLEKLCCREDDEVHRHSFVELGGVSLLLKTIKSTNQRDILSQVVRMLAMLAALDGKTRQDVVNNTYCLQYLQDLLLANSNVGAPPESTDAQHKIAVEFPELLPLSMDHVSTILLLVQVCNVNGQGGKRVGNCAPHFAVAIGRVAARVGAD